MKIRIANSAGFCYGVRRAVELAEGAAQSGEPCVMLGPIIHNQDMMDHLARHGLRAVVRPEEVPEGSEVIIRSHGESRAVHEGLHARGVRILDATCPNVTCIHQIVARAEEQGRQPIIIGTRDHPEVLAIAGWCCRRWSCLERRSWKTGWRRTRPDAKCHSLLCPRPRPSAGFGIPA